MVCSKIPQHHSHEQLRNEIASEISKLGRVSVIDLADTIGVNLYHVEKQAQDVVLNDPGLMLVRGEIITQNYWDLTAEEINERLQECSQIALAELAGQLQVGSELVQSVLEPRLGTLGLHGVYIAKMVPFLSEVQLPFTDDHFLRSGSYCPKDGCSRAQQVSIRHFLVSKGFTGIHTPRLIKGAVEGGANVFKLKYHGDDACLAQSAQLHKQMAVCGGLTRVFDIGPFFRGENSNTTRHLCEFVALTV